MGTARPRTMPQGTKLSNEWIPAGHLHIDPTYERPLSEPRIRKIIAEFDPDLIGTLLVSKRDDGLYYLIDGEHRKEAVVRSWGPHEKLPCLVYHGLTLQEEAHIFAGVNRGRTKPRPLDLHRADVVAEEPIALDIERILHLHSLTFGTYNSPNVIGAVSAVRRVYQLGGADVLDAALGLLVESQCAGEESLPAELISGLGMLIARYGHRVDRARMKNTLVAVIPRRIVAAARGLKADISVNKITLAGTVCSLLLDQYNKQRRGGHRIQWQEPINGKAWWKPIDGPQDDEPEPGEQP